MKNKPVKRKTADTRSPPYKMDDSVPTEEDLKKLGERKEPFPDIPADLV